MLVLSQSALAKLGERITPAQWDALKTYSLQDQQYDAIRQEILSQLATHVDQLPSSEGNFPARCEALASIQELLYDLQLLEHVSRGPLIGMAKLVMGMDKRRCVKRVQAVKTKKPGSGARPQQQTLQTASPSSSNKHQQRRRLGPAASLSPTFNSPANSTNKLQGGSGSRQLAVPTARNSEEHHNAPKMQSPIRSDSATTTARRGSKQRRSTRTAVWEKEKVSYNRPQHSQKALQTTKGVAGVEESEEDDEQEVVPAPSSRKGSMTGGGKRSATRLTRKHRAAPAQSTPRQAAALSRQAAGGGPHSGSSSPKKRVAAGGSASGVKKRVSAVRRQMGDDDSSSSDDDEDEAGEDEPTYCICERISFGEMICCDNGKCAVEWFHFSCVNIKIKPKGKKWFCPLCRGDKPTVLKANLK